MNAPPARPSRPRSLVIVLLALLALIGVAWAALIVAFPPAKVRALIQTQLASALRREVRFESASASLWPPVRFRLDRPALAEPGGFSRGAAFKAAAIDLDLDPFALLAHRLVIRRLVLDRPSVHLVLHADGTSNLDSLAAPPSPAAKASPPMDFAVSDLELRGARVLVDDVRAGSRTLVALDSRLGFSLAGGTRVATHGRTTIADFARGPITAARLSDLHRPLAGLKLAIEHRGQFDVEKKRLALDRLALKFGRAEIALMGVVDDPGPRARINLRARGVSVDLGEVINALAAADMPALHGLSGSGRLDFDLTLAGALAPNRLPVITGSLGVSNGAFRYPGTPASVSALAFSARFAPDSLSIPDLSARVADQPVHARLTVARFADPLVSFAVQGNIDLATVGPMLAPPDTKLGGRAALDVSGRGRAKDPGTMALAGRAQFAGVSVHTRNLSAPIENLEGAMEFSGARATVRGLSAHAGKSSFTLDATIDHPMAIMAKPDSVPPAVVDFTLRSPYLDLAELMPVTPGPALLPNARGTGRIAIARLKQQKLDVQNVRTSVTFDPTTLKAPDFALDGYGGRVSGNASFDLRDPVNPGYKVKAKVDSVQADALLSAWTPAKNVLGGTLSTTLDLAGKGTSPNQLARSLTAIGLAAVSGGQVGPARALEAIAKLTHVPAFSKVSFRDLNLPFEVRDGRVTMREVHLQSGTSEWKATGAIGFDGALDYAVSVAIPKENVARLGADAALAAGALSDPQGRVHIDLKVGGNARAPRVAWDSKAMRDAALGRISSALREQQTRIESQLRAAARSNLTGGDTAKVTREQVIQALADSLKHKKGRDILQSLFGPRPKAAPPDTAKRDTVRR